MGFNLAFIGLSSQTAELTAHIHLAYGEEWVEVYLQ